MRPSLGHGADESILHNGRHYRQHSRLLCLCFKAAHIKSLHMISLEDMTDM